jgi:hypothetical protein
VQCAKLDIKFLAFFGHYIILFSVVRQENNLVIRKCKWPNANNLPDQKTLISDAVSHVATMFALRVALRKI